MRSGIQLETNTIIPDLCYTLCLLRVCERYLNKEFTDEQVVNYCKDFTKKGFIDNEGWCKDPTGILYELLNKRCEVVKQYGVSSVNLADAKTIGIILQLGKKTTKGTSTHFVCEDGFDPMGDRPARNGYRLESFRIVKLL